MSFSFFKKHSTVVVVIAAAVILIGGIAARSASNKKTGTTVPETKPLVSLLNASDYGESSRTVSANGTVDSLQQVDLKSQASGKITKVNVSVGDTVRQGQIIATVDAGNAAAALTSARGALAQAQANYDKLLAGASSEQITVAQVALDNATKNLTNTKAQQEIAVKSAYSNLLNTSIAAIPAGGNTDQITPVITGSYNGTEEGSYTISVYATGSGLRFQASGLESASGEVRTQPVAFGTHGLYIQFPQNPASADTWTVSIPNTYAGAYAANKNAYETAQKTRDSAIAAAESQVAAGEAALAQLQAQARPADMEAARAMILTAQGQVQSAQTAYDNTIVKAPFSGVISALPVKFADLVSPGQKIATVVNQGGLQVKVFMSGEDLPFVMVNSIAEIGDKKATGTVTNVAPSIDPATKTGEVDIAIADPDASGLTVGQNVTVIIRGADGGESGSAFRLPLQAVKLSADGNAYVYTLDEGGKAREFEVSIGTVDGEHVEVTEGLTADMRIVSNAYDVTAGDTVEVTE